MVDLGEMEVVLSVVSQRNRIGGQFLFKKCLFVVLLKTVRLCEMKVALFEFRGHLVMRPKKDGKYDLTRATGHSYEPTITNLLPRFGMAVANNLEAPVGVLRGARWENGLEISRRESGKTQMTCADRLQKSTGSLKVMRLLTDCMSSTDPNGCVDLSVWRRGRCE